MKTREEYLLSKIPKDLDYEEKYFHKFEKYARYLGNGVYTMDGITSNCPRLLFLEVVLHREKITYESI